MGDNQPAGTPPETWSDAFGNQLVRQTRNNADLASHYAYTPERFRFYRDGVRDVIHYDLAAGNAVASFEDKRDGEEDVWVLSPSAGETLTLKTAERYRYTVNFVSEVTNAFSISQTLTNPDDRLLVGLDTSPDGDQSDGYYLEHLPTHDPDQVDIFEKRNGSVVGERVTVRLGEPITTYQRVENAYNWYNVGISKWRGTFTKAKNGISEQINRALAKIGVQAGDANSGMGGRGPISGNGQIVVQVEADSATSGLECNVGSMSFTTLGAAGASIKAKGAETDTYTPDNASRGTWEPVMALRRNPDRPNVNISIRQLAVTAGDGRAMFVLCGPENVTKSGGTPLADSDFGSPNEWSGQNSAAEVTDLETVTQFPDATGSVGTTATDPGGYQGAFDVTRSNFRTGNSPAGTDLEEKHGVYDGDYAVLIVDAESTTPLNFGYNVEMDE